MKKIAVIFAGGTGQRFGSQLPKQFVNVYGKEIIAHTLEVFQNHDEIDEIFVGCIEEWIPYLRKLVNKYKITKLKNDNIVAGGNNGQDTIYKILKQVSLFNDDDTIVLISDGVRPIITNEEIHNNIDSVIKYGSAITCIPFNETPIFSKDGKFVDRTLNRSNVYRGVAPQSFRLGHILEAHELIRKKDINYENEYNGVKIVDSASLIKAAFDENSAIVVGNMNNIKITNTYDFFMLQSIMQSQDIENFYFGLQNFHISPNSAMVEAKNIYENE